jgi:hypothetical protein
VAAEPNVLELLSLEEKKTWMAIKIPRPDRGIRAGGVF